MSRSRILLGFAAALLCVTAFHVHGFSFSAWHAVIDQSPPAEVKMGKVRDIRSDDWMVLLPMAFAQIRHQPPFPVINTNIGVGQNMLVVPNAPVWHPVTLFRPHAWGYFLGEDVGLAWNWGVYVWGFLASFFLLFLWISRGRTGLSLWASVALLWSPFFQLWSLNSAFLASTAALSVVCLLEASTEPRAWRQMAWMAGGGWAVTAFVLCLYPPFQVSQAYLATALAAGLLLREQKTGRRLYVGRAWWMGLAIAVAIGVFGLGSFWWSAREAIAAMVHTVYPGQRLHSGGELELWQLFSNLAIPVRILRDLSPFRGNACEASSFVLLFPLSFFLARKRLARKNRDPLLVALGIYFLLVLIFFFVGFPDWLARLSQWGRVPPYRSPIAFGVADMALWVLVMSQLKSSPRTSPGGGLTLSLTADKISTPGWGGVFNVSRVIDKPGVPLRDARRYLLGGVLLCWVAWLVYASRHFTMASNKGPTWLVLAGIAGILAAIVWNAPRRPLVATGFLAALHLIHSYQFNPWVVGGARFFRENPLSAKMLELQTQQPHSKWLVYSDQPLKILPQALGLPHWGGVHFYPQFEFWKRLDPKGEHEDAYNRYSHIMWRWPAQGRDLRMWSPQSDVAMIEAPLNHPRVLELEFNFVLAGSDDCQRATETGRFESSFEYAGYCILKRI